LWAETKDANPWGVRGKLHDPNDEWSYGPTKNAFSNALADRLNTHLWMETLPDDVPSPDAIRRLLDP
jgi:hypothetical protein